MKIYQSRSLLQKEPISILGRSLEKERRREIEQSYSNRHFLVLDSYTPEFCPNAVTTCQASLMHVKKELYIKETHLRGILPLLRLRLTRCRLKQDVALYNPTLFESDLK